MPNVLIDSEMAANTCANAVSASSLTYSFTNAAGTELIVGVIATDVTARTNPAITAVTYAGAALSCVAVLQWDSGKSEVSLWKKSAPATGANNVVITAGSSTYGIISGALSVTNANSSPGNAQTNFLNAGTTNPTVAVPNTLASSMIVAMMGTGAGYTSTAQTRSSSKNVDTHSAGNNGALTRTAGTGGTVTMSNTTTSDWFGMVAIELFSGAQGVSAIPNVVSGGLLTLSGGFQ